MSRFVLPISFGLLALSVTACSDPEVATTSTPETEAPAVEQVASVAEPIIIARETLADVTNGDWRGEASIRDTYRHPAETLEFFGIDPNSTIIEIWPGGGWYSDIIAPWVSANGGQYIAAHFATDDARESRQRSRSRFEQRVENTDVYGDIQIVDFGQNSGELAPASTVDAVLTFRNVHNFLMFRWSEKAFGDFYTALKPGGILGVVDHRLPSTREQDPLASSGYIQQAYVVTLAEEAGFELVSASEINANDMDNADHPFGVWTLPPVRQSARRGEEMADDFDRDHFDQIGESDRMTLLFRKPIEDANED
jgi:predicted methyltransferase